MIVRPSIFNRIWNHGTRISKISTNHRLYDDRQILFPSNHESRRYQMTNSASKQGVSFTTKKDISCPIDQSIRMKTNVALQDLEIMLAGEAMTFNLTWLRDSCHCYQCTHPHSRQRLYTAKDFKPEHFKVNQVDIAPASADSMPKNRIIQGGTKCGLLRIEWADGHESFYSLDWLKYIQSLTTKQQLKVDNQITQYESPHDDFYLPMRLSSEVQWSVKNITDGLDPVAYDDLLDGFKFNEETTFINANRLSEMSSRRLAAISRLTSGLVRYGLAKIINVPCERDHILKVAKSLAYERPTGYGVVFDVVVEPSEHINLAYSSREFDLHTDLPYREMSPGVQLLHCISNTTHGGLSYFSDAFRAASLLKEECPHLFEVLVQFPISFTVKDPYRNMNFRRHEPIISLDHRNQLKAVHYSPFTLPPIGHRDDVKLFYVAQDLFTSYLQAEENKLVTKMEPGDLYIFHNRRVLHGRSSYDPTKSRRFLQGCYMDWDEIVALDEKLRNR